MFKKYVMNLQLFEEGGTGSGGDPAGAGTGDGGQKSTGKGSYSFEQAEEIANARANKASRAALADFFRKQGMSEEEITSAIADYKAKQKANQPDVSAITRERDDALKQLDELKNTGLLRDKGVRPEDLDYVLFKVSQKVTDKFDFKKAADEFLKENPRYVGHGNYRVTTSSPAGGSGNTQTGNDFINNAIRNAARR